MRATMDWTRRAKLAIRVAFSQRRSSSRRLEGGGCVRRYVRTCISPVYVVFQIKTTMSSERKGERT